MDRTQALVTHYNQLRRINGLVWQTRHCHRGFGWDIERQIAGTRVPEGVTTFVADVDSEEGSNAAWWLDLGHRERKRGLVRMKIINVELFAVPPRWLFLILSTDEGLVGWGEPIVRGPGRNGEDHCQRGS